MSEITYVTAAKRNNADNRTSLRNPELVPQPGHPSGNAVADRWAYYFGYPGCPNSIHITDHPHVSGERVIFLNGSRMVPWEVDRFADSTGSQENLQQLCQRYIATIDVRSRDVFVKNLYIPAVPGVTVQSRGGKERRVDDNLSPPTAALSWASEKLRKTREAAGYSDCLPANAPFDDDYTLLGHFEGKISARLDWSFKPSL